MRRLWIAALVVITACGAPRSAAVPSASPTAMSSASATVAPSPSSGPQPTSVPSAVAGSIAGTLGYPASGIPALTVYAIRVDGGQPPFYTLRTRPNQVTFLMPGISPGVYHAIAYPAVGSNPDNNGGGYTAYVLCGSTPGCTDHSLIPVNVRPGEMTQGAHLYDWYAPSGIFPSPPTGAGVVVPTPTAVSGFGSPREAAIDGGQQAAEAIYVAGPLEDWCQSGPACMTVGVERDGSNAAYFTGRIGRVSTAMDPCTFYVFRNSLGWQFLSMFCGQGQPPISIPGQADVVQMPGGQGCANVREAPGLSGKVLGCLLDRTAVMVDGGPTFVDDIRQSDGTHIGHIWWHLTAKGWMAHDFLMSRMLPGVYWGVT